MCKHALPTFQFLARCVHAKEGKHLGEGASPVLAFHEKTGRGDTLATLPVIEKRRCSMWRLLFLIPQVSTACSNPVYAVSSSRALTLLCVHQGLSCEAGVLSSVLCYGPYMSWMHTLHQNKPGTRVVAKMHGRAMLRCSSGVETSQ